MTEDNLKHHVYNYCAIFSGKVDKTMQFVKSSGATVAFDEVHFKPETGISMLYQNTLKKMSKVGSFSAQSTVPPPYNSLVEMIRIPPYCRTLIQKQQKKMS